jgi:hypothetical protein
MLCNVEFLFTALCGRRVMVGIYRILTAYIYTNTHTHTHTHTHCNVKLFNNAAYTVVVMFPRII